MIESLIGSKSREQVLVFITARKQAYAREISEYYNVSVSPIQDQLNKLELGGILMSRSYGKTRLYFYNTAFAFYKEIRALMEKIILFLPAGEREKLSNIRTRPRRKNKPLAKA